MKYIVLFLFTYMWAWQLAGGYRGNICKINSKILWKYQDTKWYGFSKDLSLLNKIKKEYNIFDFIENYEGFWSYDEINFSSQKKLFFIFKKGWNLIGGVSSFNLKVPLAWKYKQNAWYVYTSIKTKYPKFKKVNSNEGVWVYFPDDVNISFNYTEFMPFNPVGSQTKIKGKFFYAFIIGDDGCKPHWDWDDESNISKYSGYVQKGAVSFGGAGAEGKSLAYKCQEDELLMVYKNILQIYPNIRWFDFDIEGGMLNEENTNIKRFKVLKKLKKEYPDLKISLTLPIMPEGFNESVKNLINLAKELNLSIESYNLMLMDYGEDYPANDPNKTVMFNYSKSAIDNANKYLKSVLEDEKVDKNLYYKIGAVAMIGKNDIKNEVWYKNDFALLKDYVLKKGLRILSFWSIDKDKNDEYEYFNIGKLSTLNSINYLDKNDTFYIQLTGKIKENIPARIYDIDLFDTNKSTIQRLKSKGKIVICYFSAGTFESWRKDAYMFPDSVKGNKLDKWEDERWLNIKSSIVKDIMKKRMDLAVIKGCDGIDPDNVNEYEVDSGFDINDKDQIEYNKFLAIEAKKRGLLIALKNDLSQANELASYFDFSIVEEKIEYNETKNMLPFIIQKKPVFDLEYKSEYFDCKKAKDFHLLLMPLELDGTFVKSCDYGNY
ncbi:MAG: endo alpha-1,4 polygalactosaminidase [Nautiliaceae bacterium]